MLSNSSANDALLGGKGKVGDSALRSQPIMSDQIPARQSIKTIKTQTTTITKKKHKKAEKQFTFVLKILNIILGICLAVFGAYCYYSINTGKNGKGSFSLIGYILPGYIALSGLIVLAIEMHIGFICRNMKFLYNYFGRGFFNIYVGIMPLTLLDSSQGSTQPQMEQVAIYILVSLMLFIGVLYVMAKIFCCAKQSDKRKSKRQKQSSSSSSSSSQ